jgi:hypothetical protein
MTTMAPVFRSWASTTGICSILEEVEWKIISRSLGRKITGGKRIENVCT